MPGYEILGVLARGGMSVVLKARQLALDRLVALKFLSPVGLSGAVEGSRFRDEGLAVARLRHPNIVGVYGSGEYEGRPFLVLEYVAGGSLAERLAGEPQSPDEAARLVEVLARAVHHAHQAGIAHRDLKPANILLDERGEPHITDFGLARFLQGEPDTMTRTGTVFGTPAYMAPEQAAGHSREVGPAADVYGLGAILYALLTGRPPFKAETALDTLAQVMRQEPVPPSRLRPRVPRDLETICLKCLHKNPAWRYATAEMLADDLRRFRDGRPIGRPAGLWTRLGSWAKRRWAPARRHAPPRQTWPRSALVLEALLANTDEGVLVADRARQLVQANPASQRLLGLGAGPLRLAAWAEGLTFYRPDGVTPCPAEQLPLAQALRGEPAAETEVLVRRAGQPGERWLHLRGQPLLTDGGRPWGALLRCRDVTEARARRDSEALYHSLLESLPLSVFRKDLDGRFTFANSRFCATLGRRPDEILGRTDADFFPPELAAKYRADDRRILETGEILEEIEEHDTARCWPGCRCALPGAESDETGPDAGLRYVQVLLVPVRDGAGKVAGTQGAFWSATPRMRAERQLRRTLEELQRTNAELTRSNAALKEFAYAASHDLQEPLRDVARYTQLLQRRYQGRLDADADEFIGFAVDGARRMEALIKDLLAYSRLSTSDQPPAETDSGRAVEQALANLQTAIQESGARILRRVLPVVRADAGQLVQLFQNLISNALKFRGGRPPRVLITARRQEGAWLFSVSDNGIGIDPRHHERIFQIFQRLHTREEYAGTGVGLALCKKIVERHGGRIWVESEVGQGSTFYFTLPGAAGQPAEETPPS
jgi:signal transduction histidine kinase